MLVFSLITQKNEFCSSVVGCLSSRAARRRGFRLRKSMMVSFVGVVLREGTIIKSAKGHKEVGKKFDRGKINDRVTFWGSNLGAVISRGEKYEKLVQLGRKMNMQSNNCVF